MTEEASLSWWSRRSPRERRLIGGGVIGALTLGFFVWALAPRPLAVEFGAAAQGSLSVTVVEEGRTRVREVYTLSAPISGRLERVEAEPGDPVVSGESVLSRLRPVVPSLRDRRTQAELESQRHAALAARDAAAADVEQAQSAANSAQEDFERDRRLLANGTIASVRMDRTRDARDIARAALDAARSRLRAREAEVARAEAALLEPAAEELEAPGSCCVELRAPVDGVVLRVRQESETVVTSGAPIVDIGDPRDLEIISEVLSADAVAVSEGARVRIDAWGGPTLTGHVRRVEPAAFTRVSALGIEEQRVNVVIDIDSPRDDWRGLGHDFRVDAHIETWRRDDVVHVPDAALFRRGDRWAAFVVARGRARERDVERGRSNGRMTQVVAGLSAGETVVLYPPDTLEDGMRVRARPLQ